MRIAYVANLRLPTEKAHGLQVMLMCSAFAEAGHEVTLFVPKRRNPIAQTPWEYYGLAPSFRIVEVPVLDLIPYDRFLGRLGLWVTSAWFVLRARSVVRAAAPDLVYSREILAAALVPEGARAVFEAHTFPARANALHRRLWRAFDRVVAVTAGLRQTFVEAGVTDAKLVVAHDAVDPKVFRPDMPRAEARRALKMPEEGFVAIYAGHLYPRKGVFELVSAAARAPDIRVVIVGGRDKDLEDLRAHVTKLGARNVDLVGRVPHAEIPAYLAAADAAVLPNLAGSPYDERYTSPMKLFEYLAAGKAIVASDLPTVREVLDATCAEFVPPGDAAALASKLLELRAAPGRVAELGRAALRLAEGHTWRKRVEAVVAGLPASDVRGQVSGVGDLVAGGIVLLAFAVRLLYVGWFPQAPLGGGDAAIYIGQADWLRGSISWEALREDLGSRMSPFVQPGYPLFLAAIRAIFGEDLLWIRLAQSAVSALTVLVMMRLAQAAVSRRAALAAGLLGAFHVPMIVESGIPYTETLYAFLLTLGAFLTFRSATAKGVRWAVGAGAVMAAAGAARELGFYVAALFAAYLLAARRSPKILLAFMIPVVLTAGAISLRNREVGKTYDALSAPLIAKRYEKTLQDAGSQRLLLAPERWRLYPEGLVRFFRLPHRLADISSGIPLKRALSEGDWASLRGAWAEIGMKSALVLFHWLVLASAAFGFFRGGVKKEARWLIAIAVGFAAVSIIVGSVARLQGFLAFEPLSRYRFPVEPLLSVLAGAGLVALEEAKEGKKRKSETNREMEKS